MENPPPAPDGIPQYIIDGLLRQDKQSLEQIKQYAAELREVKKEREEPVPEEEIEAESNDNENIEDTYQAGDGTVVLKTLTCGKDCNGCPHGPYKYTVKRVDGKLEWTYHKDWSP